MFWFHIQVGVEIFSVGCGYPFKWTFSKNSLIACFIDKDFDFLKLIILAVNKSVFIKLKNVIKSVKVNY